MNDVVYCNEDGVRYGTGPEMIATIDELRERLGRVEGAVKEIESMQVDKGIIEYLGSSPSVRVGFGSARSQAATLVRAALAASGGTEDKP